MVSDWGFGTSELPDCALTLRAPFRPGRRLPSFVINPEGFDGGLRTFFSLARLDERIFSPGRDTAGAVIRFEFVPDFVKLPADPPDVLAFVKAFPSETTFFERRGGVDARWF